MKHLICNLKANKTYDEILTYKDALHNINSENINLVIAPSSLYLTLFKDENINLCTQNISLHDDLNLTGDTTINQLQSLNVKYAIIGHYERRKYYHETNWDIIKKIKCALKNNLKVIYCIGESLEELERHVEYQALEGQIAKILNYISTTDFKNIIIAYEPTYMIGGSNNLNIKSIENNINFIKNLIHSYYKEEINVIYGGNINPNNINEFITINSLDGFILGTSCLDINNLKIIIEKLQN